MLQKIKETKLLNLRKLAFKQALYRTGNVDAAEDIASQTLYTYVLKHDKIKEKAEVSWICKVVENFCKQYLVKSKKKASLKQQLINSEFYTEDSKTEKDSELFDAFNEAKATLSEDELNTLMFYFHCDNSIKKMAEISEESYVRLQKRIFRIKSKLRAETYKKMGMIATKKIVSDSLNNVIIQFLKRFKYHLENNSLDKMYYYFSQVDLEQYNPCFHLKGIIDYEIILKDSIYTVYVVFDAKEGDVGSFYFSFKVDENNYLKIVTQPRPHKRVMKLNPEDKEMVRKILQHSKKAKSGVVKFSEEDKNVLNQLAVKYERKGN